MKCIIIDDEATARKIIVHLCSHVKSIEIINEFSNAIEAIKFLNKNEVDLIFLDIHMPNFTGIDFIETLKKPPKIIITTSDKNFAFESYEYESVLDYLLKPITLPRFLKAITKVENARSQQRKKETKVDSHDHLYVNINRRLIKIEYNKIYLIEAKGDYIIIKTEKENYTVHTTLKKIIEKLPSSNFLKIHRSFIINYKKIVDIEDNSVLINKDVVPISRLNKPELMKKLNLL
ncbi:LytTR family DNA-binding domain-containing protein [uncultured Marixanthomonas sp.]|uniref:LytR/AlgR family response regulator transcription factor n=1 Tax=uncultured Marixanthomonas sp. TaxID=757245 RepID=UPI0030DD1C17|tara:strand:+ start:211132 stop:211830 length:699 start_codon:yes stop_codon:yes gene_type:complete